MGLPCLFQILEIFLCKDCYKDNPGQIKRRFAKYLDEHEHYCKWPVNPKIQIRHSYDNNMTFNQRKIHFEGSQELFIAEKKKKKI